MPTNTATIAAKITPLVGAGVYPFASTRTPFQPGVVTFTSGTAAGSIDSTYQFQVTATTSGASVQLNGGGLFDPVGDSFSPVRLDALALTNTGTNFVSVGGAFFVSAMTAGASFALPLQPGGIFEFTPGATGSGLATGTGTNSSIVFKSIGGTSTVLIYAAGRSV